MIGITFALPTESSDLRHQLRDVRREGHLLFGKIDNHEIAVLHTGVGPNHCSQQLELLIHKARPSVIVSAGFAGAVTEQLKRGDLILAENFSDPKSLANAQQILRGAQPHTVRLFTSASIIDSISERNEIARASGAAAVDMETGTIVGVCNAHGIPLLSLRAISDSPSEPFPAPPSVLFDIEFQRTRFGRLLAYILRDPRSGWRLVRFGKQIARIRANLTDALVRFVKEI